MASNQNENALNNVVMYNVISNQNEYIMGPSGYIIHIWSNFGFSDTSCVTTFLPAQMSVVKPEVYCI